MEQFSNTNNLSGFITLRPFLNSGRAVKQLLPCYSFLVSVLPFLKCIILNLLIKQSTYCKVDEAGDAEADASKDRCKHKTSRNTDTEKVKKTKQQKKKNKTKGNVMISLLL